MKWADILPILNKADEVFAVVNKITTDVGEKDWNSALTEIANLLKLIADVLPKDFQGVKVGEKIGDKKQVELDAAFTKYENNKTELRRLLYSQIPAGMSPEMALSTVPAAMNIAQVIQLVEAVFSVIDFIKRWKGK